MPRPAGQMRIGHNPEIGARPGATVSGRAGAGRTELCPVSDGR